VTDARAQGEILNQALPYIQRFHGHTFVIKFGGSAMREPQHVAGFIRNVLLLQLAGIRPILVHGGGPEIDRWVERLGGQKQLVGGLRVTDEATMEIVEMVLAGKTNKALVTQVQRCGGKAIGLSGRDGALLTGEPVSEELGRAGRVTHVNPSVLEVALGAGFLPVVCPVAADASGAALNANADAAAAAIASATGAGKLILLTDTEGVYGDPDDPGTLLSRITAQQARDLIRTGRANRGMVPKLEAALHALEGGVPSVHLLNGGRPNALLIEVLTDEGIGTMIAQK
jgi:acetylglutamate kinase